MRYVPLTLIIAGAASAPAFATQYLSPEQAQKLMFPEADACWTTWSANSS
jgi:hypothetical protein